MNNLEMAVMRLDVLLQRGEETLSDATGIIDLGYARELIKNIKGELDMLPNQYTHGSEFRTYNLKHRLQKNDDVAEMKSAVNDEVVVARPENSEERFDIARLILSNNICIVDYNLLDNEDASTITQYLDDFVLIFDGVSRKIREKVYIYIYLGTL